MTSSLPSILSLVLLGGIATPLLVFAQDGFVPLVGIPFVESARPDSLLDYANALYIAAISLGAIIAVLKIIFAGVKYMLTDVVTDKSSAKADIKGALLGLVLMIGAVLLLNTINPQITEVTALNLEPVRVEPVQVSEPEPSNREEFCDTGRYCDVCALSDELCLEACNSKEGTYSREFRACSHNRSEPGVDIDDVDPELSEAIAGEAIAATGGRAQVDEAIAAMEATGNEVVFQTGAYYNDEYLNRRREYMQECLDGGGSSYQVFYGTGSEMFVCYSEQ